MYKRNIWMSVIIFFIGIALMLTFSILFFDGNIFIAVPLIPLLAFILASSFYLEKSVMRYVVFVVIFSFLLMC